MARFRYTALSALILLGACRGESFVQFSDVITVNVTAAGNGSGTVSAPERVVGIDCRIADGQASAQVPGNACNSSFDDVGGGGSFTLVATEDEDSEFVGWTGCISTNGRVCVLSFDRGMSPTFGVTATFRKRGSGGLLFDVNLLKNPDFEAPVSVGSLPAAVGAWRGDDAEVTGLAVGVNIPAGQTALKFRRTGPAAASLTGESSQQWQLIDVSSLAADIDAGKVRATAKARFASTPGDAQTDRRFDLRVGAFRGVPSEFPASYVAPAGIRLADPTVSVITANTGAWLPAELTFILPPGTRYLAVEIYAFEDVFNDATDPEFDGHFADETSLFLRRIP